VFEVPEDLCSDALGMIQKEMEEVYPLRVPLTVKTRHGAHWGEL